MRVTWSDVALGWSRVVLQLVRVGSNVAEGHDGFGATEGAVWDSVSRGTVVVILG